MSEKRVTEQEINDLLSGVPLNQPTVKHADEIEIKTEEIIVLLKSILSVQIDTTTKVDVSECNIGKGIMNGKERIVNKSNVRFYAASLAECAILHRDLDEKQVKKILKLSFKIGLLKNSF